MLKEHNMLNPKSEALNPKQIQMFKFKCSKQCFEF